MVTLSHLNWLEIIISLVLMSKREIIQVRKTVCTFLGTNYQLVFVLQYFFRRSTPFECPSKSWRLAGAAWK